MDGSRTRLVIGVAVVLVVIVAAAIMLMPRDPGNASTSESVEAPAGNPAPAPGSATAPAATPTEAPPTASAAPSGAWSSAAPDLGQDCSETGGSAVTLEIENRLAVPLELYWINFSCEAQSYGTLAPGATWSQPTFTGHRWDVGDGVDMSYDAFIPTASSTRWVIQ